MLRVWIAVGWLVAASTAHAESVSWIAPPACPEPAVMVALVEEGLGRSLRADRPEPVIEAEARPRDGAWVVTVRTEEGEREIQGERCDEVAGAAALVIALSLEGGGEEQPAEPEPELELELELDPELEPSPEPEPWPEPEAAAAIATGGDPAARVGAAVVLWTAAGVGVLPGLAPAVGVDLGISEEHVRFELSVGYSFAREQQLGAAEPGARVDAFGAGARLCWLPGERFGLCGGAAGALLRADDFNVARELDNSAVWIGVGGRATVRQPLGIGLSAVGYAELAVSLLRPHFYFAPPDGRTLHRAAPAWASLGAGCEWRWR